MISMVDSVDVTILKLLEEDGRLPFSEISAMVDIPEEEVQERIISLKESGIIRNFSALIDWERAGKGEVSAIISLKTNPQRDAGYDMIANRIAKFRQVRSLRLVTGEYDLQLHVTADDMHEIARFVAEDLAPIEGITETATHIIMKSYKENGTIFSERELNSRVPISF